MSEETNLKRYHLYHAEAKAIGGHIEQPLVRVIQQQAYANLPETGGYLSQRSEAFRVEEVLSYRSAYTQVAGNLDPKPGLGWSTLTTSVVEGLNILDVVTADRVVAQVSSVHSLEGYVPSVSFLGTRFENLRIAGHPVKFHLDLEMLGDKPADDRPYIGDAGLSERVRAQQEAILRCGDLPPEIVARYTAQDAPTGDTTTLNFSLATQVEGAYPGRTFGHMIDVPNFGKIYLATLKVEHSLFKNATPQKTLAELTMLDIHMGCIASGTVCAGSGILNGLSQP